MKFFSGWKVKLTITFSDSLKASHIWKEETLFCLIRSFCVCVFLFLLFLCLCFFSSNSHERALWNTLFKRLISVSTSLAAISALNDLGEIVLIDFSNVLNPIRNFNKIEISWKIYIWKVACFYFNKFARNLHHKKWVSLNDINSNNVSSNNVFLTMLSQMILNRL